MALLKKTTPAGDPHAEVQACLKRQDYKGALGAFEAILKQSPGSTQMRMRYADTLVLARQKTDAIREYRRVAEEMAESGGLMRAVAVYKKIVKLDPTQADVVEQLARLDQERSGGRSPASPGGRAVIAPLADPAAGGADELELDIGSGFAPPPGPAAIPTPTFASAPAPAAPAAPRPGAAPVDLDAAIDELGIDDLPAAAATTTRPAPSPAIELSPEIDLAPDVASDLAPDELPPPEPDPGPAPAGQETPSPEPSWLTAAASELPAAEAPAAEASMPEPPAAEPSSAISFDFSFTPPPPPAAAEAAVATPAPAASGFDFGFTAAPPAGAPAAAEPASSPGALSFDFAAPPGEAAATPAPAAPPAAAPEAAALELDTQPVEAPAAAAGEDLVGLLGDDIDSLLDGIIADVGHHNDAPVELPKAETNIPLFSHLDIGEFVEVLKLLDRKVAKAGDVVVREGDPGSSMFIISTGVVDATREKEGETTAVATLADGDFFGEMALLSGHPRNATITALDTTELLELDRSSLEQLLSRFPGIEAKLRLAYEERVQANRELD